MAWKLEFDEQRRVICLAFEGVVSGREIHDSSKAVIAMIADKGTRDIMTDFTGAAHLDVSTTDVYELPDAYKALGLSGPFREALVYARDSPLRAKVQFYETVCVNRGSAVRSFESRARALDWLAGTA